MMLRRTIYADKGRVVFLRPEGRTSIKVSDARRMVEEVHASIKMMVTEMLDRETKRYIRSIREMTVEEAGLAAKIYSNWATAIHDMVDVSTFGEIARIIDDNMAAVRELEPEEDSMWRCMQSEDKGGGGS